MNSSPRIAIVGIGGIFPGAMDVAQLWAHIAAGRSLSREVPADRWPMAADDIYAPHPAADKVYSKHGCFVDPFACDLKDLNISSEQLAGLDPMFHLLLHAGEAAWRDTVTKDIPRDRIGIIIGNIALPTDASSALTDEILGPLFAEELFGKPFSKTVQSTDPLNRYVAGLPAGILAKALGIRGSAFTLDAACASSLYALKLAADELRAGRADLMVTGGLSRPDCLYTQMGFSQLHALSPSGRCAPFDASADGLVVGEGAGIITLKRLDDALRDGDHIYATIAGIGLSNDIAGNLMQPDSSGQLRAMHAAYQQADWSPDDIDLIECHGTGTPIGDAVEYRSLIELWTHAASESRCVIGSVKSNVGHLLTAAGSAGLIKVLMAMRYKTFPPTAHFTGAATGMDFSAGPFRVLRESTDWPRRKNNPRRAAISGFGFGGINAHLLIEEWETQATSSMGNGTPSQDPHTSAASLSSSTPIAIVGMGAHFGPWQSLDAFKSRIFGIDATEPTEPRRWWGSSERHPFRGFFVDEVKIPLGRFRIPPAELSEMLPQQLLMLQVAADAFDDAGIGITKNPAERLDTGVFIGIGLDMNTTNFRFRWTLQEKARRWDRDFGIDLTPMEMKAWIGQLRAAAGPALTANRTMGALGGIVASRVARAFHVGGPSFTISSEETSSLNALEAGIRALQRNEINVALVGAVDLAGDLRAVLCQNTDRRYGGMLIGEGGGAVVLKRHEDALHDGDRIYAVINGIGRATGVTGDSLTASAETHRLAMERAHADAKNTTSPITYLDIHNSGNHANDAVESAALADFLDEQKADLACALGSMRGGIGHTGAASGIASLIKTALALHHETLPPCRGPRPEPAAKTFFPDAPQYWLRDKGAGPRRAGIFSAGVGGNCVHALLESGQASHMNAAFTPAESLFAISAAAISDLLAALEQLKQDAAEPGQTFSALAYRWFKKYSKTNGDSKIALIAGSLPELCELIPLARAAVEQNRLLLTDRIFYTPSPLGADGKIAFVYPGSGTQFPAMGRDLAAQFPQILHKQDTENERLASQFTCARLWTGDAIDQISPRDAIFAQVSLGTFVTDLLASFAIKPVAIIGYSLGESTGLFATKTWTQRDEMFERMHASSLFTTDLAGPCNAARQAWGLSGDESVDWLVGVINRPSDVVQEALQAKGREQVYLLIINAPSQCVIGGNRLAVETLVRDLGSRLHAVHGVTTVHCEIARQVESAYRKLHLLETHPPKNLTFYSSALGKSYQVTRDSAADAIVRQAVSTVDFTRVIRAAYADGVRFFIETGPGNSCTRMIDQILEGQPHFARSACIAHRDNVATLLRMLAHLHAQGIFIDLNSLYADVPARVLLPIRTISVSTGGDPFNVPRPPQTIEHASNFPTSLPMIAASSWQAHAPSWIEQVSTRHIAHAQAQEIFLRLSQQNVRAMGQALSFQMSLLSNMGTTVLEISPPDSSTAAQRVDSALILNRDMCLEFATGSLAKVLGPAFAHVDAYPTRVRLPDEPLMLVDRIVSVEGRPHSMTSGRVVTEHDILADAWYLDANRIPTCIAVEAGQADLFLSGYLGIDSMTQGHAVYRLLDAVVTFHGPLPTPGNTIVYDIAIESFFRQGDTHLFRFHFEATVNGKPFLTMQKGCAGFFTEAQLAAGQGIVQTSIDKRPAKGKRTADWHDLVSMTVESYSDDQITALRAGNLAACFGPQFKNLPLTHPSTLPGRGGGRMTLVHRILTLDPAAGRYGIGQITGEADIHPDDWFLTCHFIDDRVMPGTLMYECCLHTLRVYLLRMGWVGEAGQVAYEPVSQIASQLKCRGQVTATTQKVQYEVTLKEIGYAADGTPFAVADALMYADGKPIVQMTTMSVQLTGLTRQKVEQLWKSVASGTANCSSQIRPSSSPLFNTDRITAFALGKPSEAFGVPYRIFDPGETRKIARLPGPPYQFLDRITHIEKCEPFKLAPGGIIEAQYDVPMDAWYFAAHSQIHNPKSGIQDGAEMPFSILLEIALQPCGWLAAYLGSALTSTTDLKFRNLGGAATQFRSVHPITGTLTTTIKITNVSHSGGMIIQHFDMAVRCKEGDIYKGTTYFGFFSKDALANQVGIRDAALYQPAPAEIARAISLPFPTAAPFADRQMRMVDHIDHFDSIGGPKNLGFIRGTTSVDPDAWFFKAHFFEDPVWPGSLGLESFIQLLKFVAHDRWAGDIAADPIRFQTPAPNEKHTWIYRGQILPTDKRVTIEAVVTQIDDTRRLLRADGFLIVDNRVIYQMKDFTITMPNP